MRNNYNNRERVFCFNCRANDGRDSEPSENPRGEFVLKISTHSPCTRPLCPSVDQTSARLPQYFRVGFSPTIGKPLRVAEKSIYIHHRPAFANPRWSSTPNPGRLQRERSHLYRIIERFPCHLTKCGDPCVEGFIQKNLFF